MGQPQLSTIFEPVGWRASSLAIKKSGRNGRDCIFCRCHFFQRFLKLSAYLCNKKVSLISICTSELGFRVGVWDAHPGFGPQKESPEILEWVEPTEIGDWKD